MNARVESSSVLTENQLVRQATYSIAATQTLAVDGLLATIVAQRHRIQPARPGLPLTVSPHRSENGNRQNAG